MLTTSLIAISFSLGFLVESILGFGGALIAYAILGFFIDFKEMILAGLYIGTCSSAYIIYTDHKSFDKKLFKSAMVYALIGTVLGVFVFTHFSTRILSSLFGILLLLLTIKIMFFDKYVFPKIFKRKLILIGGISQGAFGVGGPFWANALQRDFKNKSGLRTSLAAFFVSFNFIRFIQLGLQNQLHLDFFINISWTIIPVFIAIKLGHKIHLKINENYFKKGIAILTLFAAIKFIIN
jgi:uncharacterized membrane protein YfcA